jgi:hypothetical protein
MMKDIIIFALIKDIIIQSSHDNTQVMDCVGRVVNFRAGSPCVYYPCVYYHGIILKLSMKCTILLAVSEVD